jgi:muconolactone delta-isomerase
MKYLVTALPGTTTLKIKYGARLFQATKEWVDALLADGTFDCHYGFSDLGALSIVNADSHEALLDKILECPVYPYFNWEIKALCDWQHIYDKNIEYFKKLGG